MSELEKIYYRDLKKEECYRISEIDASEFIARVWREVDGERKLIEINYKQDTELPNGHENHLKNLQRTIADRGIAIGAFCGEKLIGFISVNSEFFGITAKYVLLDQLFISKVFRGNGIGKALFFMASREAKAKGAEKLYICAGSSERTIAFYRGIGCEEAVEINQELYELDTRDYQLEYDLCLGC